MAKKHKQSDDKNKEVIEDTNSACDCECDCSDDCEHGGCSDECTCSKCSETAEPKTEDLLLIANDKFLRLAADFENYKKRAKTEKDQLYAFISAETINSFLPVFDNLDRAAATETIDENFKKGINMVLTQLNQVFDTLNIKKFGDIGEEFNPQLHNAVMQGESDDLETNMIMEVMQKGYKINDKVIRHALVKVVS